MFEFVRLRVLIVVIASRLLISAIKKIDCETIVVTSGKCVKMRLLIIELAQA